MIEPRVPAGASGRADASPGRAPDLPHFVGALTDQVRRGADRPEILDTIIAGASALARTPRVFLLELVPADLLAEAGAEAPGGLSIGALTLTIYGPDPPLPALTEAEWRLLLQLLKPGAGAELPSFVTPPRFALEHPPAPFADLVGVEPDDRLAVLPLDGTAERAASVLALFDCPAPDLPDEDRAALRSWGGVASLALEQLALRDAERRTRLEGEELRQVALALTGTLDLEAVLARVLAAVQALVGADWASIALVGEHTGFVARHFSTLQTGQARWYESTSQLRPGGTSRRVLEGRQPHFVGDLAEDPDANPTMLGLGVRAVATLPMIAQGQAVGLLYANFAAPHAFTPREGELLGALAAQAAVAIRNAELYSSLRRSESELRAVLESQETGICLTDRAGDIRYANRAFADLVGREPAALIGRPLRPVVERGLAARTADPVAFLAGLDALDPAATLGEELELRGPEPRLLFHGVYPACDEAGAAIGRVDIYRDITELRRLERVRDDFLAIAAHELRTPLSVIRSHAHVLRHLLAAPADGGGEPLRSAGVIVEQSAAMAAMVAQFLDMVRLGRGAPADDFAPVDLGDLLARAVEQARATTDRHDIALRLPEDGAGPGPVVQGNAVQLARVLTNLLDNAIKYSPDGGTIAVECRRAADHAVIAVRDDGLGLTEDQARQLFARYYRAHGGRGGYSGLGLGLYLCQEIVGRHNGRIEVASPGPGRGATFTLHLPLAASPAGAAG